VGKTRDDIVKITYQFCVSLNIQPARVCEGITELFGVWCKKYIHISYELGQFKREEDMKVFHRFLTLKKKSFL
jgi:hypothetical protein